jgi:alkanesulfonate monooxygenase SsuD/methylene tetrahydromethanopterin reductase-like flavin-dependent oxidoreductase (luciferase family)
MRRKHEVLRRHCAALGRPYESVLRSHFRFPIVLADTETRARAKVGRLSESVQTSPGRFVGTPREAIAEFRAYVAVGVRYFILIVDDAETARLLAERVLPDLQEN